MKKYNQFLNENFNREMLPKIYDMLNRLASKIKSEKTTHDKLFDVLSENFTTFNNNFYTNNTEWMQNLTRGEYLILEFYNKLATNRICFGKIKKKLIEYYKTNNRLQDVSPIISCIEMAELPAEYYLEDIYNILTEDDIKQYLNVIKEKSFNAWRDEAAVGKWLESNKGMIIEKPSAGEDFKSVDLKDKKFNVCFQVKTTSYTVNDDTVTFDTTNNRIYKKKRTGYLGTFKAYYYAIVNGENFIIVNNDDIVSSTKNSITVKNKKDGSSGILECEGLVKDNSFMKDPDYMEVEFLLK